jgi:SAM-dependent methyltransferase
MEKNTYDFFAEDYHNKRRYHWRELEKFLRELNDKEVYFEGYSLDLGCANGRNFNLFLSSNSRLIGIDNSKEFLKLAIKRLKEQKSDSHVKLKYVNLILSDIKALPLRPSSVTNIFSIATIHHIRTETQRKNVISQLYKIIKDNGFLVLTVWRRYQKKYRCYFISDKIKRLFVQKYRKTQDSSGLVEYGDKYIPWTLSNRNRTFNRFYHFFAKKEIKKLLKEFTIKIFSRRGGPNKRDNFFILTQKVDKKNS